MCKAAHVEAPQVGLLTTLVVYNRTTWCTFQPKLKKFKNIYPETKFLIFQQMELSTLPHPHPRKKEISYILRNGNPKNACHVSRNKTLHFSTQAQKFLKLQETKTPKKVLIFSYILENRNPKKVFIFHEKISKPQKFIIFFLKRL